jgi:hypothetical protein
MLITHEALTMKLFMHILVGETTFQENNTRKTISIEKLGYKLLQRKKVMLTIVSLVWRQKCGNITNK